MKYKSLLSLLEDKMVDIVQEMDFTASRMFDAAEEKETMILLRKLEDLNQRLEALHYKMTLVDAAEERRQHKQAELKPSKKKSKRNLQ